MESADRRAKALELRIKSWSQADIADELGVTQQAVSKMLNESLDELNALAVKDAEKLRELELSRLDELIRSKWQSALLDEGGADFDRILRAMDQRQKLIGLHKTPPEDRPGDSFEVNLRLVPPTTTST